MYTHDHHVRFEVLIHKVNYIILIDIKIMRIFQIDSVHEADRLERYSTIQKQVHVMLHECSIEKPLIK